MTTTPAPTDTKAAKKSKKSTKAKKKIIRAAEHTVEVVSDSGEGAQKCGQIFGRVSARMGNGVWTVEIIPAEIQPPPRTPPSASGNRIRIGTKPVTNWGDAADLVIAFNEQVLLHRHRLTALKSGCKILIESVWKDHEDEEIREQWAEAMRELDGHDYEFIEVPLEELTLTVVDNPQRGKNMVALGIFANVYSRDLELIREEIREAFKKKAAEVADSNIQLLELGYDWAEKHLAFKVDVKVQKPKQPMVVMNGNQAIAVGAIASGMELCAMYPITPATSASHYLSDIFEKFGGIVHQAEDEIAAAGVATGASFAGKVAFTITSGPGLALKTEFIGLAVMTETPLVVVDVQRGGPSTGLPTKVEQGDLLAAIFGQPGDAPKVVLAPATMEECFLVMTTARRIAEAFRCVVVVLTDANLATGVQPFPRPVVTREWIAHPIDLSAVPDGTRSHEWDPKTGLSRRTIPGQPNGMFRATGLSHDEESKIGYSPDVHERGCEMRARKMAVFQQTLSPPTVYGDDEGDLLVVGWGSTLGAIEEAVDRARDEGLAVSSLHLRFLSPLEPGLEEIFQRFEKVITVEINYSDDPDAPYITEENRRRGQLAWLLRAQTLVDIDNWTRVPGEPLRPGQIHEAIRAHMPNGAKR
ncbi:MAG: 2-oxoacid:acceptor oxidoreductase subunit alpha [Gemmatimonadales bacterium]|jgi:2-oxoglutarate ferredoxin oxidoreductase subunit alpha